MPCRRRVYKPILYICILQSTLSVCDKIWKKLYEIYSIDNGYQKYKFRKVFFLNQSMSRTVLITRNSKVVSIVEDNTIRLNILSQND